MGYDRWGKLEKNHREYLGILTNDIETKMEKYSHRNIYNAGLILSTSN